MSKNLLHALRTIAYEFKTPEEIREDDIGLPYEEHLEMAYENIQSVARGAILQHKLDTDGEYKDGN